MQYSRLVTTFQKIEATTKRLEITSALVAFLSETPSALIDKVVYLIQGQLYPDYLGVELGIAEKLVVKSISKACGKDEAQVTLAYKREGDLGIVVEKQLSAKD